MRLARANFSSLVNRRPASRSGVALVITIVMLSVITFLTVAFLALMGREKGAVKTSIDQTTAQLAAGAALERAKAEMLASMLATTNLASFDLLVSTNFINYLGYSTAPSVGSSDPTNVNFAYANGTPLNYDDSLQNLTNLLYSPRVPVFITNRLAANSVDFRYYLDLNRNFRHDRTGLWPVTNQLGVTVLNTNSLILSNYFIGDPEWIGGLDRPDKPHGPDNKFLYRYAYVVVPEGKTLDVNYIHNQAFNPNKTVIDSFGTDFYRNQGIGSWEINLAAFLHDVNTNIWGGADTYNPLGIFTPSGNAFTDAGEFYRYRLNGNGNLPRILVDYANSLPTANVALGSPTAFGLDLIDGYSAGPLMTTVSGLVADPDNAARMNRPWSGADSTNHFFTTQELFDPRKSSQGFTNRLTAASTGISTYDQYTYYRMLAQLGTGSAPEDQDKLNLNYKNINGSSATNFVSWNNPTDFFTNAVDRLLKTYTAKWLIEDPYNYTATFGTNGPFGVANIPVWVSNRFVYTPSVHRIIQLAANIYDASTNRFFDGVAMPSVFRPVFKVQGTNLYVADFKEVSDATTVLSRRMRDPLNTPDIQPDDLVFGVPLVIGAKKGFPNFNEFSMQNVFEITRKLQVTRDSIADAGRPIRTNIMFTVGVSNTFGAELWNSYVATNTRLMDIYITNYMVATLTNNDRSLLRVWQTNLVAGRAYTVTSWPGFNQKIKPQQPSLIVPLNTNAPIITQSAYNLDTHSFQPITSGFLLSGNSSVPAFPQPQWGLAISNRLHFVLVDRNTQRIIDYVNLRDLDCVRDLSEDIRDPDLAISFEGLWSTNILKNLPNGLPQGIFNQIDVSMGKDANLTDWNSYGIGQLKDKSKQFAIDYFRKFNSSPNNLASPQFGYSPTLTNLVMQVPFSPTKRIARFYTWQANDPLVHYLSDDLKAWQWSELKSDLIKEPKNAGVTNASYGALGTVNVRYLPWGGPPYKLPTDEPENYNAAVKDPGVTSSDAWNFHTNKFPTVGWLGRVHRGTPWQTIYLKSKDIDLNPWTNWVGTAFTVSSNIFYYDAVRTLPKEDRVVFDVFTTALNDNAARGRLPINQTGLAAWSAVFSGVVALTNTSSLTPNFAPLVIQPAGIYDSTNPIVWPPLVKMIEGINTERARTLTNGTTIQFVHPNGSFQYLGDILATPQLTDLSPFLNPVAFTNGITDAVYEWLPQQTMSLLQLGEPRFVVYAYGQALQPAPDSIVTAGGAFFGLCTNYAITAEVATRAVVRIEGSPNPSQTNTNLPAKLRYPPRIVVESFNYLPPE